MHSLSVGPLFSFPPLPNFLLCLLPASFLPLSRFPPLLPPLPPALPHGHGGFRAAEQPRALC